MTPITFSLDKFVFDWLTIFPYKKNSFHCDLSMVMIFSIY